MRVIFLDIDGVLNSSSWAMFNNRSLGRPDRAWDLDPRCVFLLRTLVESTDAYIVMSSTWRRPAEHMQHWFAYYTWYDAPIVGHTPYFVEPDAQRTPRGDLIRYWLGHTAFDVERYVVLDDNSDAMTGMPLVQTDFDKAGLTWAHISEAYRLLTGEEHCAWTHPVDRELI